MFVLQGEKTVCILCYKAISVVKEYNVRLNFDTIHRDKYATFILQEKQQIVQELKGGLQCSRIGPMFTKATTKTLCFYIVTDFTS